MLFADIVYIAFVNFFVSYYHMDDGGYHGSCCFTIIIH